jgi:hypothetical protein
MAGAQQQHVVLILEDKEVGQGGHASTPQQTVLPTGPQCRVVPHMPASAHYPAAAHYCGITFPRDMRADGPRKVLAVQMSR